MLRRSGSQNIYRVSDRSARKELTFQLFGKLTFQFRHIQSALAQRISQHHSRTAGMGNNGEILSLSVPASVKIQPTVVSSSRE